MVIIMNCRGWYKGGIYMNKPFTIIVQETEQEFIKIIDKSSIPVYVLKTILQNLYNQLDIIDNEEMRKYADILKTNKEKQSQNKKESDK